MPWIDHPACQDGPVSVTRWLMWKLSQWMMRVGGEAQSGRCSVTDPINLELIIQEAAQWSHQKRSRLRAEGVPIPYMRKAEWPDEKVAKLRQLVAEGKSGGAIAKILGATRSAVLAKAMRLKLTVGAGRKGPSMTREERRAARRAKRAARKVLSKDRHGQPTTEWAALQPPAAVWEPLPGSSPVKLAELTDTTCRWPLGAEPVKAYCGNAIIEGHAYCPSHCRMAYKPRYAA